MTLLADPLNVPPVAIDVVARALEVQFANRTLRHRATMLWGTRGVGKSSIVRALAARAEVPLIDLRLTTIEPVDLRGALLADDERRQTIWYPPEFLPTPDQPAGILFLDELTAADQRLQSSAYSLILDRRVGEYRLPDGWMVVAAGNAAHHGAVSHDMGTALADRLFHFNVQCTLPAFTRYALERGLAPEILAFLQIRPDRLEDTASQLAQDHLIGASPRGWEAVSDTLGAALDPALERVFVQGRVGAANAAEFFGVLAEIRAGVDVQGLLDAVPGEATRRLLPRSLDALYGLVYGLVAVIDSAPLLDRAFAIVEQFDDLPAELPAAESRTLAMELLLEKALHAGLEAAVYDSAAWQRYQAAHDADRLSARR